MDPSIEKDHYEWTPYGYVYNDPIRLGDPDGRDSTGKNSGQQTLDNYTRARFGITIGDRKATLAETAEGYSNIGFGIVVLGYGGALFTDGGTLALVPYGEGLMTAGSVLSAGNDVVKGNIKGGLLKGAATVTTSLIGSKLKGLEEAGKLVSGQKEILGALIVGVDKITEKPIDDLSASFALSPKPVKKQNTTGATKHSERVSTRQVEEIQAFLNRLSGKVPITVK